MTGLVALHRSAVPEAVGDAMAVGASDGASTLAAGVGGGPLLEVDAAGVLTPHPAIARTASDQVTHRTRFISTLLRPYDASAGRL